MGGAGIVMTAARLGIARVNSVSLSTQALIYSLAYIGVGVAVAPARASAARLILFSPSFRTAFLGRKS
ncbi:MAG: hypothetical protein WA820_13325, partial [Bradyrhizobium sp.]